MCTYVIVGGKKTKDLTMGSCCDGSEADRETLRKEIIPSAPSACTGEGRTTHDRGHGVVGVEGDA